MAKEDEIVKQEFECDWGSCRQRFTVNVRIPKGKNIGTSPAICPRCGNAQRVSEVYK